MDMKTNKSRSNYALLLLLVAAFLTMQWSTTHIHLAEHHNHDGDHHQHQAEAHAHNIAKQHADAIDYSHHADFSNTIEIDHEFPLSKREKQKNSSTVVITPAFLSSQSFFLTSIKIPVIVNTKLSYFSRSTVHPRAPPQTS